MSSNNFQSRSCSVFPDAAWAALRARVKKSAVAADSVLVNRLLLHAESALVNKDGAEAGRASCAVSALLIISPDAGIQRRLDSVRSKVPKGAAQAPAAHSSPKRKAGDPLIAEARAFLHQRLEAWLAEYETAGCRPGRQRIQELAKGVASVDPAEKVEEATADRLRALTPLVEPSRRLSLFFRSGTGDVSIFRNGLPFEGVGPRTINVREGKPEEFRVFADDLIQFAFSDCYASIEKGELFLVAACVRLDGQDLPSDAWRRNASEDPQKKEPRLVKLARCVKRTVPPETPPKQSDAGIAAAVLSLGAWIDVPSLVSPSPCTVPFYEDLTTFEKEFAERQLPLTWLGLEAWKFVLALRIPAE